MKANYFIYELSEKLSLFVPQRIAYLIGKIISSIIYSISRYERQTVKRNLGMVLSETRDQRVLERETYRVYQNFSRTCVDFLYYGKKRDPHFLQSIRYIGEGIIDEALKLKKGLVILSAHLGNWELGAMAIAAKGYPLTVIANPHSDKRIDRVFVDRRKVYGIQVAKPGIAVRRCLTALKRNELVGLNGDRRYTDPGVTVKLFNGQADLPKGPVALSRKTGAPIVSAFLVPETQGYRIEFAGPIYPNGMNEAEHRREAARLLENMIASCPNQWCAFQDIWHYDG